MNPTITRVRGIEVGHWTDTEGGTGCTVVALPEPNVVAVEIRGAAPGSRETALLEPGMRVEQCQAILLTGGSVFGLAAADGVVGGMEEDGRGHITPAGPIPIVPAAVIFDFLPGRPNRRPGRDDGLSAYRARSAGPVPVGLVGAGTGATAAKWRGFDHMVPGGLGSAVREVGDAVVGALVVLNPVGDVFSLTGESLTGGPHEPGPPQLIPPSFTNTTLIVVATDARLTRNELGRLCVRANDALATCVRPAHTRFDGDVAFGVSCGAVDEDVEALAEGAYGATASAIENAFKSSQA